MQRSSVLFLASLLTLGAFAQSRTDLVAEAATDRDAVRPTEIPRSDAGVVGVEALPVRLHVYPDPACDQVVINAGGAPLLDVRVFDLDAREVIMRRGLGIPAEILQVGDLPSGTYVVRVKTATGVGTSRLVVQ